MQAVHSVAEVRAAEERLFAMVPDGALMDRASSGLAHTCAALLADLGPGVAGARVVLLVGSGNNGGDALWAGAKLAARGVRVDALLLSDQVHEAGLAALVAAGGRAHRIEGSEDEIALGVIAAADLVLDGIVGIGGTGALRPHAEALSEAARDSDALTVAVDIPSGVNADTGAIAGACIDADVTVTFGCLKPGLLLAPGRSHAGAVVLIDIGLDETLGEPTLGIMTLDDLAECVPEPSYNDYKYSRGVVGIIAGSSKFHGAAFLATDSARHGDVGMVRYLDRGNGLASLVVERFWDVVTGPEIADAPHVTAWAAGPGMGQDPADMATLTDVLATPLPVLVDADGLTLLSQLEGSARAELAKRAGDGRLTVITPHQGEFARLGYSLGSGADEDRLGAARAAARDLGVVVLLKGPGSVIAAPDGTAYIDTRGGPELGTAGSGDVLSGLAGALLAGAAARGELETGADAARVMAAAAGLHGVAGSVASHNGRPVTAMDIVDALPEAVSRVRRGTVA